MIDNNIYTPALSFMFTAKQPVYNLLTFYINYHFLQKLQFFSPPLSQFSLLTNITNIGLISIKSITSYTFVYLDYDF